MAESTLAENLIVFIVIKFLVAGYGHSTPKTDGGKMFTMIYAIIGIPIGLVMFNSIGERFNYFASMIINKFRKMVKARQPETTELDLICVGLTLSGIVFTSGAAAFSHYEGKQITKDYNILEWFCHKETDSQII